MKRRVPYLLVALSLVPLLGGIARLVRLTSHDVPLPADERFALAPVPVIVHILCAVAYSIVGAFQFDDQLRRARPGWHRRAGWVLVVSGLFVAVSGVWMTLSYAIPKPLQGDLVYFARLVVGVGMAVALGLAIVAIRGKNVRAHRAWMIRAYALAQGAGTQAVLLLPPTLLLGHEILYLPRDLAMTAAWVINVVVAELIIRNWRVPSLLRRQPPGANEPSRA